MHYFYKLLPLLLLLFAPGCVPFAYVKPEVDIYHASLPIPEVQPGEDDAVVAVEISHEVGGVDIQRESRDSIKLIPLHGNSLTNVTVGREWSVGILSALSHSIYLEFDSTVKVYRRGYETQTVEAGLFGEVAKWKACKNCRQRELAIDTLSLYSDVAEVVPGVHFRTVADGDDSGNLQDTTFHRTIACIISPTASRFLIREYEYLAEMARDSALKDVESRCGDKAARLRQRLSQKNDAG